MRTLALALCCAAAPAWASCGAIVMPPAQFDHPLIFNPIIRIRDYWEVDKFCRQHGTAAADDRLEACSYERTIVIPAIGDGVTLEQQRCYFRHERAHLEGWTNRHEGGSFQ